MRIDARQYRPGTDSPTPGTMKNTKMPATAMKETFPRLYLE